MTSTSMLTMTGKLINVFESVKGVGKTGEEYGGKPRIQLLGELAMENESSRFDLVTLTVDDPAPYNVLVGKDISVPVGVWSKAGSTGFFVPKGSRPKFLPEQAKPAA